MTKQKMDHGHTWHVIESYQINKNNNILSSSEANVFQLMDNSSDANNKWINGTCEINDNMKGLHV